ncbi:MAG: hypothetical protein JRH11_05365 [Deltaproteobacteria bacterium]|nr:hypothetical protein [Deltaproteobacteria bacterium]
MLGAVRHALAAVETVRARAQALGAGLEGYVRAAAKDLPEGPRVNVVSPPFVRETGVKLGMGNVGVPAAKVAEAYVAVAEGDGVGETVFIR